MRGKRKKINITKRPFYPFPFLYNTHRPSLISTHPFSLYLSLSPYIFIILNQWLSPAAGLSPQELANSQEILEETSNQRVVLALYEALRARDVDTVHKLLASDLEWWFHGPPSHQFMMRLLTGSEINDFQFVPQSFASFGSTVLVEGCDHIRSISWVHAWTVTDGIITQVREYFNTSLTVTRLGVTDQSSSSITSLHCPSVWESSLSPQELANSQEILEETSNQRVVLALYEALRARDVDTVHKLLASDLEWWFHGPPSHQFMMRLLTGSEINDFQFVPQSFASFGSTVLVEGCDHTRSISWVHAWTVTDGIITQVREYFNTSLTVTRLGVTDQSSSSITSLHCPSVWESSLSDRVGKSVPGLVLAI
ncbi:hypothetical protein ACSBR1_026979 [Camellia fascicularis]